MRTTLALAVQNPRGRARTLLILASLLSIIAAPSTLMAIEEPSHRIVETYPDFELRRYAPHLVAETVVDAGFDKAGNRAFGILADYIFGKNRDDTKIEMTAPVTQQPAGAGESSAQTQGQKIEMTAPVTQRPADGAPSGTATAADRYVVSFVMPQRFTLETLPEPLDPRVTLCQEPERLMAVRRYSGRWTKQNYREEERRLLEAVRRQGLEPVGAPVYARYNSPFSLWFMRRNEVMVEVRRSD
ncbi:heme-binding protein [uncultured Thiohalocapsa sp.]|uniref:SOUL family heme-binding protein n=1 Tax=uncultured Thiohalocapsa sp. TaxID=768990 RepID=UPI0025E29807|nr:heme-binding protein [uncultured Thiohalocapsa sp.]